MNSLVKKAITGTTDLAVFWPYLHKQNNGIFYRGVCKRGKGKRSGAALGVGLYVTWKKGMAKAFGEIECGPGNAKVESYRVPLKLKMADARGTAFCNAKRELGFNCWDNIPEMPAKFLTADLKQMGFDGVVSDNPAEGIVIFDKSKAKNVGRR